MFYSVYILLNSMCLGFGLSFRQEGVLEDIPLGSESLSYCYHNFLIRNPCSPRNIGLTPKKYIFAMLHLQKRKIVLGLCY